MRLKLWSTGVWLRAASLLTLLLAAGHSAGGLKLWSPIGESNVLLAMRDFKMNAQGEQRSYFDFYMGFGWTLSVYLLLQMVVLWQIASLNKSAPTSARAMIVAFIVANVLAAILARQFLFVVPVAFFLCIAGCLVIAWWAQQRQSVSPRHNP